MKYFCAELLMEHKIGVMSQAHSVIALYIQSAFKEVEKNHFSYV